MKNSNKGVYIFIYKFYSAKTTHHYELSTKSLAPPPPCSTTQTIKYLKRRNSRTQALKVPWLPTTFCYPLSTSLVRIIAKRCCKFGIHSNFTIDAFSFIHVIFFFGMARYLWFFWDIGNNFSVIWVLYRVLQKKVDTLLQKKSWERIINCLDLRTTII